jgi:hypothetical protein
MLNSHKPYYSERSMHGYAPIPLLTIVLLHEKVTQVCEETKLISLVD